MSELEKPCFSEIYDIEGRGKGVLDLVKAMRSQFFLNRVSDLANSILDMEKKESKAS